MYSHRLTTTLIVTLLYITLLGKSADAVIFEEFLFDDPIGTAIEAAANNVSPGNLFDADTDNAGVVTNGLGQLDVSTKNNDDFGSNYVDVDPITTGIVYGVIELTWDFQSVLNTAENEAIRLTLVNADPRSTQVTAEVQINRSDSDVIVIDGAADGTGSSDLLQTTLNGGSLTQSTNFVGVVAADLDNDTYEILYSTDDYASFQSAGIGSISPTRGVESLRMVLNNDFVNDNVLIDRVYLTDVNPAATVDLLTLQVNTTTGFMSITNDTGSSFDIDYYSIESSAEDLDFANWNSLSDQEFDAIDGLDPGATVGDGIGETWDEAGGSDNGVLSESFLLSSSIFDPAESVSIGKAFQVGGDISSLTFEYRDAATGNILTGEIVEVTGGIPADLNNDGFVDGLDLGILLGNWGTSTTPDLGELNGTPPVDGLDLGILLGAWNPPPVATAVSVPEPSNLLLFALSAMVAALKGREVLR